MRCLPVLKDSSACPRNSHSVISCKVPSSPLGYSTMSVSPRPDRARRSSEARYGSSRVAKAFPKNSSPTLRRALSTRPARADSSRRSKDSAIIRPLTQATASPVDPFKMHPTTGLKVSSSVPLRSFENQEGISKPHISSPREVSSITMCKGPDEINEKLSAMLAATEALKPATEPTVNSGGSKMSRIVAKMSTAFGKLNSKTPPTLEPKCRGKF